MSIVLCPDCGEINESDDIICKECEANLKLNEKYYLREIIGENYGTTYRATIENEGNVLIKELSMRTLDQWKTEELFKREALVLSQLKHKAIPEFIENFSLGYKRNSRMYIVMEFIEGKSLEQERKERLYREREILELMKEILNVLNYIHSLTPPIIHRDLKPDNIMRRKDGSIVLIDFGSVRDIIKPNGGSTLIGTSGYMPPEQFMGKVSKKSDYYALGVTIVVMLSRKSPEELYEGLEFKWQKHIEVSEKFYNLLDMMLKYHEDERIDSSERIESIINDILNNDNKTIIKQTPVVKENKINKQSPESSYRIKKTDRFSNIVVKGDVFKLAERKKWLKIRYMLKTKSVNIDTPGKFKENLLYYSIDQNNIYYTEFLLEHGINVNNQNIYGQTALNFALQEKKYEIVNILLKYNVNLISEDNEKRTALMFAATTNLKIFKRILNMVPSVMIDQKDKYGDSALFYAYRNKHYDIVKCLMDNGSDINQTDRIGETILIKTARTGDMLMINEILKYKPEPEIKDMESETALLNAIKHKNYDIFKILVNYNADINTQDDSGMTPLMKAVIHGNKDMVKYIIDNGGNAGIKNNNGETALWIARHRDSKSIIHLLL